MDALIHLPVWKWWSEHGIHALACRKVLTGLDDMADNMDNDMDNDMDNNMAHAGNEQRKTSFHYVDYISV